MREAELDNCLNKKFKFDFNEPTSSEVNLKKLASFLAKDSEPVLIFYGGEPLLEIEKIKAIIDGLEEAKVEVKFRMQTNAKLLNKLPINYLNKISKILVSLDGTRERTDNNRGKGTYELVIDNLKKAQAQGYQGELIARMVIIKENPDIFEQVKYLVENKELGFTSIHWQIDAGFYKFDYNKTEFSNFVKDYNNSISKLIDYWITDIKTNKRVLKLYPFLAIVESLLKNEKTKIRCGAGHEGYAITTNGKIVACPIMNCIEDFKAGTLDSEPSSLKKFDVSGDCIACTHKDLCGGRCLYWNQANLWPKEGNKLICKTIRFYIDKLKQSLPEIKDLIKKGIIKSSDFDYEKYFGPEIIP
jgi:putative peptide-modifying radical SAM enzyme